MNTVSYVQLQHQKALQHELYFALIGLLTQYSVVFWVSILIEDISCMPSDRSSKTTNDLTRHTALAATVASLTHRGVVSVEKNITVHDDCTAIEKCAAFSITVLVVVL